MLLLLLRKIQADWSTDAKLTLFASWQRSSEIRAFGENRKNFNTHLQDVTIYKEELNQKPVRFGYVLLFLSTEKCNVDNCREFKWESFVTTINRQNPVDEKNGEVSVEVAVGSNWDVKELVFRDPGTQERVISFKI